MLYKGFEPKEGEYVQFLGVHALSWKQEWGKPTMAFIENDYDDDPEVEEQKYTDLLRRLREAVGEMRARQCKAPFNTEEEMAETFVLDEAIEIISDSIPEAFEEGEK